MKDIFGTNADMISKTTEGFDWESKRGVLTKAVLNIISNFILNEIVATDDRDSPWINNKIKSLIKNKTKYFKNCFKPKFY